MRQVWCLLLLLATVEVHEAWAERTVKLRSGSVELTATSRSVAAPLQTMSRSASAEDVPANATLVGHNSAGDGPSQYLIAYQTKSQRRQLRKHLLEAGAVVVAYLPGDAWLVYATFEVVKEAWEAFNVSVAEYLPSHKFAPEWQPILVQLLSQQSSTPSRSLLSKDVSPQPLDRIESTGSGAFTQYTIRVVLVPKTGAKTLRTSWQAALEALLWPEGQEAGAKKGGCRPTVRAAGKSMMVAACPQDLPLALSWLASQAQAVWLEPVPKIGKRDIYADLISQVGRVSSWVVDQATDPVSHPFWSRGLDGHGQLLGVGDNGMDMDSCYFFDPQVPDLRKQMKAETASDQGAEPVMAFTSTTHRKVARYYAYQAFGDAEGHGTHVSGLLAGACRMPDPDPIQQRSATASSPANATATTTPQAFAVTAPGTSVYSRNYKMDEAMGMAPGAKLAFYDIGDENGAFIRPPTYDSQYLGVQRAAGVFIQSDSWGEYEAYTYDEMCAELDMFTWLHPEFLIVTAAGNDGALYPNLPSGTVSSPANAKNTLSIGASGSIQPDQDQASLMMDFAAGGPTAAAASSAAAASNSSSRTVPAYRRSAAMSYGTDFTSFSQLDGKVLEVVVAEPRSGCSALTNAAEVVGKLVLMTRGPCYFYQKAQFAQQAGAAALVVMNDSPGAVLPQYNPAGVTLPVAAASKDLGDELVSVLLDGQTVQVSIDYSYPSSYEDVAAYSSYGPTSDQRYKPDLIAPGSRIVSAWTDKINSGSSDGCSQVHVLSGTSMACPIVSGAAAIARQYFQEGYYPTGAPDSSDSSPFTPSGVLLKAVLIGGAANMRGVAQATYEPLAPAPSSFQGFGRLDLSSALPLEGNTRHPPPAAPDPGQDSPFSTRDAAGSSSDGSSWRLQLVDMVEIEDGDVHSYSLAASGSGAVVVTLVWYDYPGSPVSEVALVNNLDLEVALDLDNGTEIQYLGNGHKDDRNTVERVTIPSSLPGKLTIRITATDIPSQFITDNSQPQYYALVVHGAIDGAIASINNPAYRGQIGGASGASPPASRSPPPAASSPHPPPPTPLAGGGVFPAPTPLEAKPLYSPPAHKAPVPHPPRPPLPEALELATPPSPRSIRSPPSPLKPPPKPPKKKHAKKKKRPPPPPYPPGVEHVAKKKIKKPPPSPLKS